MHSQQQPTHRTLVTPKKKAGGGCHAITRQIFALPALQQFEPVLASSPRSYVVLASSIPKIETAQNKSSRPNSSHNDADRLRAPPFARQGSPGVAAVSSSPLLSPPVAPRRPKDRENAQNSPRTIPREDEEIRKPASSIPTALDDDQGRDEAEQFVDRATNDLDDDEEQTSEDEEREEFTTIRFVSPRSADANRIRTAPGETRENHIRDERSAGCQDVILAREEGNEVIELVSAKDEVAESEPQSGEADVKDEGEDGTLSENRLLRPLLPGHYHEPFLTHESDKSMWLRNAPQKMPAKSLVATKRPPSASKQHGQTGSVLYKLLWKDLRSLGTQDVMVSVFLSSEEHLI
ncbi:hypothetical protein FI667_g146, partial [Globisporangium splendens]